jgi:hypothetical protein
MSPYCHAALFNEEIFMIKKIVTLLVACGISSPVMAAPDMSQSLAGAWTGTLQYRDYGNDRQVTLPTTVTFSGPVNALRGDYVYDDGPGKTVRSSEQWALAPDGSTLTMDGAPARVTVYRAGPGADVTLEVEGMAEENKQAVAMRTLLNRTGVQLTITRLTQLPGQPWLTRHVYRFVKDK